MNTIVEPYGPVTDIYRSVRSRVIETIQESPMIKTFVLEPEEEFSFRTGEFIELTLDGVGEAPFTPSSSPLDKEHLEVTVMKCGYVTDRLHQVEPGEILGIRGPYGRGYPLDKFYGKQVLILSGGCGFAPIRSLMFNMIAEKEKFNGVTLCYGSKTPQDCIYKDFVSEVRKVKGFDVLRTVDHADEHWEEQEGVVTKLVDDLDINIENAVAVVCGPPVMMKFGTYKLVDMGFKDEDIWLSMEKNMSCGCGKCGHCMMGDLFVCKDGPVFSYAEIKHYEDIWK
jgi:NAD(P)H-flavin reductase